MNVEIFSYSALASALGILIVFLSLCGLSLLMVTLKIIFKARVNTVPAKKIIPDSTHKIKDSDWIPAAVSVFLILEEPPGPSAISWGPVSTEKNRNWINRTSFANKMENIRSI
jgi:hypothetical protein